MSEDPQDQGKKKLSLENLDKVVGGIGVFDAFAQAAKAKQLADAAAEMEAAKAKAAEAEAAKAKAAEAEALKAKMAASQQADIVKAKAPAADAPEIKIVAPEAVKVISTPTDQVAKDIANEVAKLRGGGGLSAMDAKIWEMSQSVSKSLGISQPQASSLCYAMTYKAVFEDGAATGMASSAVEELKNAFFATNGGRHDVLNAVVSGFAIEAALAGDLGKFVSRETAVLTELMNHGPYAGTFGAGNFISETDKMLNQALSLATSLPGAKGFAVSLESAQPGASAELLKGLVKTIEYQVVAAKGSISHVIDPAMPGVLAHLRDATMDLFKQGSAATADNVRLLRDVVSASEKIMQLGLSEMSAQSRSRAVDDLTKELVTDVSKYYAAAIVNAPGSAGTEFSKKYFDSLLTDLNKWGTTNNDKSIQAVFAELGKLARLSDAGAINELTQYAKNGVGTALSVLESLAGSGAKAALPALESLARGGANGAWDSLQRLAQTGAEGVGAAIERLAKAQVQGAMTLVEKLVKANAPGAAGILENLVKQGTAGVMPMMENLARQNVQPVWNSLESLARQRKGGALALLDKMARDGGGTFEPIRRLYAAGATAEVEKLAKDGMRGAMGLFADLAKTNPAVGYAAIERLARGNASGAMDTLEMLVRQQAAGSLDSLGRLAANYGGAMSLLGAIALEKTPGAVQLVENLVHTGAPGSAGVMANLVFKNIEPLDRLEGIARQGSRAAHEALDQLAESRFTGALGAIGRVTRFEVDQAHQALLGALSGNPLRIAEAVEHQASRLEQRLGLDHVSAVSLVKADLYDIVSAGALHNPVYETLAASLAKNEAAAIAKGIGVTTMLFGDAEKGVARFSDLMARAAAPLAESAKGEVINKGVAALQEGQALMDKTRVGKALNSVIADPTNEDNYKRLIAEGVLASYGGKNKSAFGAAIWTLQKLDQVAQNAAIGKVFDTIGVSDQVRQAARACGNMATNMQDAFVECYTEGVLNTAFDVAKNTGKNCYDLGKSVISGNPAEIGKAMGNLMEGLANDYIDSIKTYYMKGGGAALKWTSTIVMGFLDDTGATPYAEKFVDINKEAAIRIGNLAADGSKIAVAELGRLVNSSGKFAEDAAGQLLRVADKATGPVREQALRAIGEIGRLGGPAKEVLYKVAGALDDGANAVAHEVTNLYRAGTGWAEDAWNSTIGKLI
jgi:hypothetical protein